MSSDLTSIQSQFNLNAAKSKGRETYEFEEFRLNAANLMLYRAGEELSLAPKVVETLLALIERRGEIVSKREMMSRLWAGSFVADANLTQNIYLLRKTLGKAADGRELIETFRRRGYRFSGTLKAEAPEQNQPLAEAPEQPSLFDSLAVLPFRNELRDETAEYLSDGVTESIINRLSQLEDFRVVARNTVFRYKNAEIDPQQLGRDLSVSAVLTGRILQFGEKLIVRAELTDTANGWQIWGAQYDRRASDVLELQETIAREISEKLELKLSGEEQRRLAKRDTKSSEAYNFYVKGRYLLNKRLTETIEQATVYFQRAIDLDPTYALAYVGLADCYPLLSLYGKLAPHEAYPKAERAAREALEIDDRLAEAYNSLGVVKLFYEWDWTGAETAFQKAIALKPNYADAHQRYGMFLTARSRFDEAAGEFEKAILLDPLSLIIKTISGYPFYYSRRFAEAARRFGEVVAADENYSMAHFRLGLTYAQRGEFDRAIAALEKSAALSNDRDTIAACAFIHGLSGDRAKAGAAQAALEEREKSGFVTSYNRALIEIGAGEFETALDWLEKAFEERSYWLIYLKVDPALDALRENSRFGALEKKIFGLADEAAGAPARPGGSLKIVAPGEKSASRISWRWPAAVLCLLLLAALGITRLDWRGKKNAPPTAPPAGVSLKRLTPDINAIGAALSPDGKYLVYVRQENDQKSVWVKELATDEAKQLTTPETYYNAPQFSPDGRQIYFKMERNRRDVIARIPFAGGPPQKIAEDVTSPFAFSPDGRELAFVREQSLVVAAADGGGERILSRRDARTGWFESWGSQLSWSPDGRSIAVCGGRVENEKLRVELTEISVSDGRERPIPVPDWDYLDSVQWLPNGSGLIVIARETSGAPFQLWHVAYPPAGDAARITQDFQDYSSISLSADARLLVATQEISHHNIWTMPAADPQQAKQITSGTAANDGYQGVALTPDGRIVYTSPRSGNWDLWIMNADGSNQRQLTAGAGKNIRPRVSADGRYIFFCSDRGRSPWRVWRIDIDGGNPKQMTDGESFQERATLSPDGEWFYFNSADGLKSSIRKMPVEGGAAVTVAAPEYSLGILSVSPDNKLLAVSKYEKEAALQWQTGVLRADTGEVVKWFDRPMWGTVDWSGDSKSLIFTEYANASNLWQQPIDGGAARLLTKFDAPLIRAFDHSADGKTLVMSRGNSSAEAVLITNFR